MTNKEDVPVDTTKLVLERKKQGMRRPNVNIDDAGQLSTEDTDYKVVVRKSYREGDISNQAKALKECKGLKGCEFAACSLEVMGKLTPNLKKTCPELAKQIEDEKEYLDKEGINNAT